MNDEQTWDPPETDRAYVRHVRTGDRGWMVRRDGQEAVRYDRPHDDWVPYREQDWQRDLETRPFTKWQVAQICQAADQVLCRQIGLHDKARKSWLELTEAQRSVWVTTGPKEPMRQGLYAVIQAFMKPFV